MEFIFEGKKIRTESKPLFTTADAEKIKEEKEMENPTDKEIMAECKPTKLCKICDLKKKCKKSNT